MTVQRTNGHVGFSCDGCPMSFEEDEAGSFHEAWAAARRAGWRSEQIKGEWSHYCPSCARGR
jgi:hypothetical protein